MISGDFVTLEKALKHWEEVPRLHSLLPYESYDPKTHLFFNQGSTGFILQADPIVGASLRDQEQISSFFRQEHTLPEGVSIQFLLFANPCIGPQLEYWNKARRGDIYKKLAEKRTSFLSAKAYEDSGNFLIRDYQVFISYTIPGHAKGIKEKDSLLSIRKELKTLLESLNIYCRDVNAEELIQNLGMILNIDRQTFPPISQWNQYDSLSKQIIDSEKIFFQEINHLALNDGRTICKSYTPKVFPRHWSLGNMDHLLGSVLEPRQKISCPFLIHYGLFVVGNQGSEKTRVYAKRESLENSLRGGMTKFVPFLKEQHEEHVELSEQLQMGERVVLTNLSYTIFTTPEKIHENEQELKSIWQSCGFVFQPARNDHLPLLMSSLPMTWTLGEKKTGLSKNIFGFGPSLENMGKAKKTITKESQNLLPLLGEWKGQNAPGMPLVGRRGQLFFWNPFGKAFLPGSKVYPDHNFNVVIAGQSGSGKSVFMNEMMTTVMGVGGKVFVLDKGRSFKKTCQLLGGTHIEFTIASPISLNPFTNIPEGNSVEDQTNREEMLSVLSPIFQTMAAPKVGTDDLDNAFLEEAIRGSWEKYGARSSVDSVVEILSQHDSEKARNLGQSLFPFSSKGSFGHFFNPPASVSLKGNQVVIETDDLRNYPSLMTVVVQMLILQVNQEMAKGDRITPFHIIIDEAWQLLRGKSSGDFFSEATRTARKYKGSIVLGTQHLTDYFREESPAATEAFNCSAWKCILYQESDVITALKEHPQLKSFVDTPFKESILHSIHSNPPNYSEIALFGPGIQGVIGRLRLDPFSRLLYSTNAEEYNALQTLINKGASIEEAVEIFMNVQESGGMSVH